MLGTSFAGFISLCGSKSGDDARTWRKISSQSNRFFTHIAHIGRTGSHIHALCGPRMQDGSRKLAAAILRLDFPLGQRNAFHLLTFALCTVYRKRKAEDFWLLI